MAKKPAQASGDMSMLEQFRDLLISDVAAGYTAYKIELAQQIAKQTKLDPKDINTIYNIIVLLMSAEADVRAIQNRNNISLPTTGGCCGGQSNSNEGSIGVKK